MFGITHSHFSSLLGCSTPGRPIDPNVIGMGPVFTLEQQLLLCSPITKEAIKSAVFSIPGIKSPGLDGFNSTFYKTAWDHIGPLVSAAIEQFFTTSSLPSYYGRTKLVLLPKVPTPATAQDFRPISCCTVIYKCIAKLLAARLKQFSRYLFNRTKVLSCPTDLFYLMCLSARTWSEAIHARGSHPDVC